MMIHMNEYKYPPLMVKRKNGSEQLKNTDTKEQLIGYWMWAHSDICSNAERGVFAEYLVSLALNCADGVRDEWSPYDVHSPEDIKIEVKASAYIQTWTQKELSTIQFSIRPARAYDYKTNLLEDEVKRQSDVYVFCVENCKDQELVNPLDLNQWDFYVIATNKLDRSLGPQKTITLKSLEKIKPFGAIKCKFSELRKIILNEYEYQCIPFR